MMGANLTPRVSVIVRSYNRLPALCELLAALQRQTHRSFEVVVVEQSTDRPAAAVARLAEHAADSRIRIIRAAPLGGARARNVGVAHAHGDIIVCIDDDDLPGDDEFLETIELPFIEDPACLGVTCHHEWDGTERIGNLYRVLAARRCMRFASLTRLPCTYARYDRPIASVDYVHGTGGAYRHSVFERFGGWDEDTPIEDEASLALRVRGQLGPHEHFVFDPRATLRRRMAIDGGLGKRWTTPGDFYRRFMTFVHHVMARYHPLRVRLLYPLYVWGGYRLTLAWLWSDSLAHRSLAHRLVATIAFTLALPWHLLTLLRKHGLRG